MTAAELARRISTHHQVCVTCRRGGLLAVGPGGVARVRCEVERALFAALGQAREDGPDVERTTT